MVASTNINFDIIPLDNCKLLGVLDLSFYNPNQTTSGNVIQIIVPGYTDAIELSYNRNGVTIFNSNNLGLSNVTSEQDYMDLPDGAYVIKMSVCPYEVYWKEQIYYRVCKLQCKFLRAVLQLDLNSCTTCYNTQTFNDLWKAWTYLQGAIANGANNDLKNAKDCYNIANNLLDQIIDCKNC